MRSDVNYEFINFEPDDEFQSSLRLVAENLHDLSPINSIMKVAFKKSRDAVQAKCRIVSIAEIFEAETECDKPQSAIQNIEYQIRKQLESWKSHRFEELAAN